MVDAGYRALVGAVPGLPPKWDGMLYLLIAYLPDVYRAMCAARACFQGRIALNDSRVPELCDVLEAIADQLERVGDMREHKDGRFVTDARRMLAKARGEICPEAMESKE